MKKEKNMAELPLCPAAAKAHHGWLRPAVIILLLAAAGVVWYLNSSRTDAAPEPPGAVPAVPRVTAAPEPRTARQRREEAYEKDLAAVQQLMQQPELPQETRRQAGEQAAQMIREHQTELGLEAALTHAGFAPCFVLMQNDALTIAVSASEITAAQSAVILSLCLEHAQVASENIRIMPGVL
jgi:hypothetical protein